jgi:hypothetical protein
MTQRGGVLYAQDARDITRKRDQKDTEKETRRLIREAKRRREAPAEQIFENITVTQAPEDLV